MQRKFKYTLSGVGAVALIAAGAGIASAASSTPPAATRGCVSGSSRTLVNVYENASSFKGCTTAQGFAVNLAGGAGPAGPAGPQGAQGAPGPSGVVSTGTTDLGAVASVDTGGSFVTRATQVGTVQLSAGTYLINVNAKATPPSGGTGTANVFPEFFVYNQAANPSFTGDLFNVGSGEIVVPTGGETLHVYAFGYDSDTSAGTYALDDLSVTTTQINT